MYSTLCPKHLTSFSATANVAKEANKIRVDFMIDFGRNGDVMLKRPTELTRFASDDLDMQRFNEKNYGTADSSSNKIHFDEFDDKTRFGKQSVMDRK